MATISQVQRMFVANLEKRLEKTKAERDLLLERLVELMEYSEHLKGSEVHKRMLDAISSIKAP